MRTITIDIINDKALNLLRDLEQLNLIRLRKETLAPQPKDWSKYKGAMTKVPIKTIDAQLNEIRSEWE
jgi:hypothetical protein